MFADHSPIDERDAAVRAGIGIIGKNGLIITEKYSSYVFLAELIVGAPLSDGYSSECQVRFCEDCGICKRSCPWLCGECDECLSALTQKKGELTKSEQNMISKYGLWGCDICSEVCPHTKKAKKSGEIYSQIKFFNTSTLPYLTYDTVAKMSDEEFSKRAYSWRGRDTILRNAKIAEITNDKEGEKK
jgi:epoxyqueuosine reductase